MNLLVLASEAPNGKLLPGDIKEFWWGLFAFVVVFGLLAWKVGPVFKRLFANRAAKVEEQLAASERAQQAAAEELASLKARLGDADAESARIVAAARETATRVTADGKVKAASDVAAMKERAHLEIEAAKAKAQADLQAEVNAATLAAAEELVRTNLDDTTLDALVERYIEQVGA